MRARLFLRALLALAGTIGLAAGGQLRSSSQAQAKELALANATKAVAEQPIVHILRRPESLAGKLVAPDFPAKQKASDPFQVATSDGNVTFSNDLGPQTSEPDAGVGLKPLFIIFVAAIFFAILVAVCVILPRLQGVTLGIAGSLEHSWRHSDRTKSVE
ncbi:unnamed protein product [Symbiodinium pilosum]|uniref:Uncharacterized protein n=1 Tax=Symbiodinium pilosum TaxID=2952 RepID=A0A812TNJ1_SYMPI|nr:unnamed protein product [Symbiodinium pilosum]